jgi:hypothetical protein
MFNRLLSGRVLMIAAGLVLAAAALAWFLGSDALFRMSIHPPGNFDASRLPPAPDYAQADAWALRPETPPAGAWETPWGVDVFFIHPTSAYDGLAWNAAWNDPAATGHLEREILPSHAGPFLHAGPVYAPRYRQAGLYSELNPGDEGDAAFQPAYDDVLRAFDEYLAADNRGRAIIIAGIGQGGVHALRLVRDRFQAPPLKDRLAAAYIIEAAVPTDMIGHGIAQPVCAAHADIHCIVAWSAVTAGDGDTRRRFATQLPVWTADNTIAAIAGRPTVCVNPLTWTTSPAIAPPSDHRGAARAAGLVTGQTETDPEILPRTVSARCTNGLLDLDRLPDFRWAGWGARYMTPDYNLFYADIAFNAAERARAASVWLDEHAQKPLKPLPAPEPLNEAPIHRPSGVTEPVH